MKRPEMPDDQEFYDEQFRSLIGGFHEEELGIPAAEESDTATQQETHAEPSSEAPTEPSSEVSAPPSPDAGLGHEAVSDSTADEAVAEGEDETTDLDAVPADAETADLGGQERMSVALILTPLASADTLTVLMATAGLSAEVIGTDSGAVARVEVPADAGNDVESLLGSKRPLPPEVDELARQVSRLIRGTGVVALVSWLVQGDDVEPGVSGQITARRYEAGEPQEDLPAGLLIAQMDPLVEELLTARLATSEVEGVADTGKIGRWQAMRMLRKIMRKQKDD